MPSFMNPLLFSLLSLQAIVTAKPISDSKTPCIAPWQDPAGVKVPLPIGWTYCSGKPNGHPGPNKTASCSKPASTSPSSKNCSSPGHPVNLTTSVGGTLGFGGINITINATSYDGDTSSNTDTSSLNLNSKKSTTSTNTSDSTSNTNTTTTNTTSPNPQTYQSTFTGYGGNCQSSIGSCGFLGNPTSNQAAVSAYWNTANLPGQCGTCWRLSNASNIAGDGHSLGSPVPNSIVVMVTNTCAPDLSKPGFQCNQDAQDPTDKFGSVTVFDLCFDSGTPQAFWGKSSFGSAGTGGLAVGDVTQVSCAEWEGEVQDFQSWSKYEAVAGPEKVALKSGQ